MEEIDPPAVTVNLLAAPVSLTVRFASPLNFHSFVRFSSLELVVELI